jgi:hypothetical protein
MTHPLMPPAGYTVWNLTPMMADVIRGAKPRPVERRAGQGLRDWLEAGCLAEMLESALAAGEPATRPPTPAEIHADLTEAFSIGGWQAAANADATRLGAEPPPADLLAAGHAAMRWPKKKRNADLRRWRLDPDGPDGAAHRRAFVTLLGRDKGESR